ncbi:probable DNA polymerase delta subunit 3 at N-terminal half [Coccomyxa sp. Obi]|nr:probable DNA polymerase delta subunit 3 at N-terminal half [Coccomyxa sp. Obi]
MVVDRQKIFNDIQELVGEQLKVVSFKWLARHFSVPANTAKKVLSEFLEKNQGKVSATYLISGWTKGPEPEHSIQLVDAGSLTERRKKLDPITSLHVYSVQPTQPKDASELWNTDNVQTMEFFTSLVKSGSDNCLADNRWSAVQCQQAKRDPSVSKGKAQAARMPSDPPPGATAPANGVVAAIKNAAAGKGGKEKNEKAPAAAVPEKAAAAPAVAPAPGATHGRAVAAAKALTGGGGGKKKDTALSAMWSKAPPRKAKDSAPAAPAAAKAAEEKPKPTAAVDAEAALRLNDQAESSSESEEEQAPIQRVNPGRRAHVLHDEPADSDADSPVQPARKRPRSGKAAPQKRATVLNESDDGSDWEIPKKTAGRGGGTAKQAGPAEGARCGSQAAAAGSQGPEAEEEGQKKGGKRGAEKKAGVKAGATKRPSPGTIKVHDEATGGPKRKKVLRTTYNDKGEEVTEMVYEDEPTAEPANPASEPQENEEDVQAVAAPAKQEAEPAMQPAAPATKASSQSQGSAGVPPKKEPAKAGAKKGKDKMVPGQRGIKSFFAKK